jgi:hypothetical protein
VPYLITGLDSELCRLTVSCPRQLCYERGSSPGSPVSPAFLQGGSGCSAGTPSPIRPAQWTDLNLCLRDGDTRILVGAFVQTDDNSVSYCLDRCRGLDYAYAGLENGNQCWCSSKVARGSGYGSVRSPSACDSPCAANASETCGGPSYGLSLWQDLSQVPIPFDPNAGADWQDSGLCLRDSATRILVGWTDNDDFMTPQYCQCASEAASTCPPSETKQLTPSLARSIRPLSSPVHDPWLPSRRPREQARVLLLQDGRRRPLVRHGAADDRLPAPVLGRSQPNLRRQRLLAAPLVRRRSHLQARAAVHQPHDRRAVDLGVLLCGLYAGLVLGRRVLVLASVLVRLGSGPERASVVRDESSASPGSAGRPEGVDGEQYPPRSPGDGARLDHSTPSCPVLISFAPRFAYRPHLDPHLVLSRRIVSERSRCPAALPC